MVLKNDRDFYPPSKDIIRDSRNGIVIPESSTQCKHQRRLA